MSIEGIFLCGHKGGFSYVSIKRKDIFYVGIRKGIFHVGTRGIFYGHRKELYIRM